MNQLKPFSIFLLMGIIIVLTLFTIPPIFAQPRVTNSQQSKIEGILKKNKTAFQFEANQGQWTEKVKYKAIGSQGVYQLLEDGISIGVLENKNLNPIADNQENFFLETIQGLESEHQINGFVWNLKFKNAHPKKRIRPKHNRVRGRKNFVAGKNKPCVANVASYSEIWYESIYRNIDLRVYNEGQGALEYDFIVYPGANPKEIRMELEGIKEVSIAENGELTLQTPLGTLRQSKPYVYQIINDKEVVIPTTYSIHKDRSIGFHVNGKYNKSVPLIIDPTVLISSTYLGGNNNDQVNAMAVDDAGNIYLTGQTLSANFPITAGSFQTSLAGSYDIFVSKLTPEADSLIYSTYIGGNSADYGFEIKVTANGEAIIGGYTQSRDYPTTANVIQDTFQTGTLLSYITRLNAAGNAIQASTLFGGSYAAMFSFDIDDAENVYLAGMTAPRFFTGFPITANAYHTNYGTGLFQGWAAKISTALDSVYYATYLPGNNYVWIREVAVTPEKEVIIGGNTTATDYPTTTNAFQPLMAGSSDFTLTKLNTMGTDALFSTYLGGVGAENIADLTINENGDIYLLGYGTNGFPTTTNSYQDTAIGSNDGLIIKMNAAATDLLFATYIGGTSSEVLNNLTLATDGSFYVTGYSQSTDYPASGDAFQKENNLGSYDGIISKLSADASTLLFSTFIGGASVDNGMDIKLLGDTAAILVGMTNSDDFPITLDAYQENINGTNTDIFISRIACRNYEGNTISPLEQTVCILGFSDVLEGSTPQLNVPDIYRGGVPESQSNTVSAYQWQLSTDSLIWSDIPSAVDKNYLAPPASATRYFRRITLGGNCCPSDTSAVAVIRLSAFNAPTAEAGDPQAFCPGGSATLGGSPSAVGGDGNYTYEWYPASGLSDTTIANPIVNSSTSGVYTLKLTDGNACITYDQTVTTVVQADAGPDVNYCANGGFGVQIGMSEVPKLPPFTYTWSPTTGLDNPNIGNPIATPEITTTYMLTVDNGTGCPSVDQVVVTYVNFTADAGNDLQACQGLDITIGNPAIGGDTYIWSPSTYLDDVQQAQPTFQAPIIPTENPMPHYLTVIDDVSGCSAIDTINIQVNPLPLVDLQEYYCFIPPDSALIGEPAIPDVSYSWAPSTALNDSTLAQPKAAPTEPTVYTLTVTTAEGCTDAGNLAVYPSCEIPFCVIENTGPNGGVCNSSGQGVQIGPTEVEGFNYSWTPSTGLSDTAIARPIANPTVTTTYYVTLVNANDPFVLCNDSIIVFVPNLPTGLGGIDTTICSGESVQIGTAALGGVSYEWTPTTGLSSETNAQPIATPQVTTTYFLTATVDATGCITRDTVIVTVNGPIAQAGPDESFCEGANVTLGSPALPNQGYLWQPGTGLSDSTAAQPEITLFTGITFFLEVTDSATGCQAKDTIVFTQTTPPITNAGAAQIELCAGSSGVLLGATDSTAFGYTYSWSPTNNLDDANLPNPTASPSVTTTYTLTVIDPARPSCVGNDQVEVQISTDAAPIADAGLDVAICLGEATTIGTAGVGGLTYAWIPSEGLDNANTAQPNANPTSTMTYTLTVYDPVLGCEDTDEITVTVQNLPVANAGVDQQLCLGDSILIGATSLAGLDYSWTPSTGLNNPNIAQPKASPTANQQYILTVTDNTTGCEQKDTVDLSVNPLPTANAGGDQNVCTTPVTLGVAATGDTYTWAPALGLDATNVAQPNATPLDTTLYVLAVTNSFGCQLTDTVQVNPGAVVNIGSSSSICQSTSIQIGSPAIDGYTYSWMPTIGLDDASSAQPTASPSTTTTYELSVTNGGCTLMDSVLITINEVVVNAGENTIICQGASHQIGASPISNYSYSWSPVDSLADPNISNPIITTSETTELIVYATNNTNGCTRKDTVNIGVFPIPSPIAIAGEDKDICYGIGDTIGIDAIHGLTYSWTPTNFLNNPFIAKPFANPLTTTTYELTVVDTVTGCLNRDYITLTPFSQTAEAGATQMVCTSGVIQLQATDLGASKNYSWFPTSGLDNPTLANPIASAITDITYQLTVTDTLLGCTGTDTVSVLIDTAAAPTANAGFDQSICFGEDAIIGLDSIDGITYSWSPTTGLSNTTVAQPTAAPLLTTTYTMTVSNASGNACPQSDTIQIIVDPLPIANAGQDQIICIGEAGIQIGTSAEIGYTYTWIPSNGLDNPNIAQPIAQPTETTTYVLYKTNTTTNCVGTDTVKVTVGGLPITNAGTDTLICIGESILLGGNSSTNGFSYQWSPSTAISDTTIAQPFANPTTAETQYILTITYDETGCSNQDTVLVSAIGLPSIGASNTYCQDNNTGGLTTDDYFTVYLNTTNVSPGAQNKYVIDYNNVILNPGGTDYTESILVGTNNEFLADGSSIYTLTIKDLDKPNCQTTLIIGPVEDCSVCSTNVCIPIKAALKRGVKQ